MKGILQDKRSAQKKGSFHTNMLIFFISDGRGEVDGVIRGSSWDFSEVWQPIIFPKKFGSFCRKHFTPSAAFQKLQKTNMPM